MVDVWSYQHKEIEAAHPEPVEDEALETEKRVLANAEKLYAAANGAFEQLYEGDASAEGALRAALRNVEELARYDARFTEAASNSRRLAPLLATSAPACATTPKASTPRPSAWPKSKTAWPCSTTSSASTARPSPRVIAFGEEVARKLAEVVDRDEILKVLRAALDEAAKAYRAAASALTAERKAAAPSWPSSPKPRSTPSP